MPKILIFIPTLGGGGAERTIVNLAKSLNAMNYSIVIVVAKDSEKNYEEHFPNTIKIIRLHCKKTKYSFLKLIYHLRKENPTIIFSTLNFSNIYAYFANVLSCKHISIVLREATHRFLSGEVSLINKLITNYVYNKASKVVALSEGVKDELVDVFKINKKKISVIYNPVDIISINRMKDEPVYDFDFLKHTNVLIYAGRFHPQKDLFTLLKACKILKDRLPFKLLLLGEGSQEGLLKEYCNTNNLNEHVWFLGFKKNPYKYISRSDVLVLSSSSEGFGHVIVEAMALGIPVISTNCPSGPMEIIRNNEYGELVEIGNYKELASKILYIMTNSERKNELKILGQERAKDFALNKIGQEYHKMFRELI